MTQARRTLARLQAALRTWVLLLLLSRADVAWGQTSPAAKDVAAACPTSNFYGQDYYVGPNLLNNTITTLGGCCQLCGRTPHCAWTWCPANATDGCVAPLGPPAANGNFTYPAGTCLLTSLIPSPDSPIRLSWSRMQPGVPWVSGSPAPSAAEVQFIDSAASYNDNRQVILDRSNAFFCRKVSGGPLKLSPLEDPSGEGLDVADGQEVRYTGLRMVDPSGVKWSLVVKNATVTSAGGVLWMYPSAQLAFCDSPPQGCEASTFGQYTEEGATCEGDLDCCKDLVCRPRGTEDVQLASSGVNTTAQAPTFPLGGAQPWATLPNECRRQLSISEPLRPDGAWFPSVWTFANGSVLCSSFNLSAFIDRDNQTQYWMDDPGVQGVASSPANIQVDPSAVQAYRDELCSNAATANATLAQAILAGGAEAQQAYLAMTQVTPDGKGRLKCPDGTTDLAVLFVYYATDRGTSNAASMRNYAAQLVAVANSVGHGACVDIVVVDLQGTRVLEGPYRVHNTPAAAAPPSPSLPVPAPAPGASPSVQALVPNGTVRLSGSLSCSQGVAEVAMAGSWGAVCSSAAGGEAGHAQNARVICRGQGLPSDQLVTASATATPEGTPTWLQDLQCKGTEASILDCPHKPSADGRPSAGCLLLSVTCMEAANSAYETAMCTNRPGRCQKLPGSCTPTRGYCTFQAQPEGSSCLGGVCDDRGQCVPRGK